MQKSLFEYLNVDIFDKAVRRVKEFFNRYRPGFIYAFYSGGKDSTVSTLATLKATDRVIVVYTEVVGNTHRTNIELVREFAEQSNLKIIAIEARSRARFRYEVSKIVWNSINANDLPLMLHIRAYGATHGEDFVNALRRWGLPRGYTRWCHHEFKSIWWSELPFTSGNRRYLTCGVRASESSHRRRRWLDSEGVLEFRSRNGVDIALSPIYDFSDGDIQTILTKHFPAVIDHYRRYGDSLNCVFCPLRSVEKQRKIVENLDDVDWSKYVDALMEWSRNRKSIDESRLSKIIDALRTR